MAAYHPSSYLELRDISGVGDFKTCQYGERFLSAIRDYLDRPRESASTELNAIAAIPEPGLSKRTRSIVSAYLETHSVGETCAQFSVKPATVYSHLCNYVNAGNSLSKEIILKKSTISEETRENVIAEFQTLGTNSIGLVWRHLDGKVPYSELSLMKLVYILQVRDNINSSVE